MAIARTSITTCVVAAALMAAGCGGGGKSYSAGAVADCLRGKNFQVSSTEADFIAQANGGFYVSSSLPDLLPFSANVSFGDVGKLKDAYAKFPGGAREESRGNVLIVWDRYNATGDELLRQCLR